MKTANNKLMDLILKEVSKAPESHISQEVRKMFKTFRGSWWNRKKNTPSEKFEFISQFNKESKWFFYGQISGFVAELCDLKKHYQKP